MDLFQEALKMKHSKRKYSRNNAIFVNVELPPLSPIGIGGTPPFYIYIIFELCIVHNYLIYIEVSSIVMPKFTTKEIDLYYTRCVGVLQLKSTPVDVVGYVKHVNMDLNHFPQISIP